MYGLDVNFLSDRAEFTETPIGARQAPGDNRPYIIGGAVAGGLLLLVGGVWGLLQFQIAGLQQEQTRLDSQLSELNSRLQAAEATRKQTGDIKANTAALAGVFNQIKPWSAMLQDIRDRTPDGVQIRSVTQADPTSGPGGTTPSPSPRPAASPSPGATASPNTTPTPAPPPVATTVSIAGVARSFGDVNDFVLVLKQSRFLKEDETRLQTAELVNNPVQIDLSAAKLETGAVVNLPKVVSYSIQSSISDVPASELVAELNSNGAVGLINRIETLRTKGVIQQ
jgi:type IV pilus assembly protein PilN